MPDYTVLDIGTTDAGEIATCPHCDRNGLVEVTNGATFYVHSTGTAIKPGDIPYVGWDMCPKPAPTKTTL